MSPPTQTTPPRADYLDTSDRDDTVILVLLPTGLARP